MPFVNSFDNKKRIKTELGYSNTCHASMYSGVFPNMHQVWFKWQYSPETSPYSWLKKTGLNRLPDMDLIKYASYKYVQYFGPKNTSFFGIPFITSTPYKYWYLFDVVEKKFWNEPNFLKKFPTIFDILRAKKIPFDVVGMVKNGASNSSKIVAKYKVDKVNPWTYFFIGDIDSLSHKYGQDSKETISRLRYIDDVLYNKFNKIEKESSNLYFFLFSDHGHIKVEKEIDIHSSFRVQGENINNFVYFIDSTFARFWVKNEYEKKRLIKTLNKLERGRVLTEKDYIRYHVNMDDNRYGDIIFSLDPPYIFAKPFSPFRLFRSKRLTLSMHGYNPDFSGMDGVLVSNISLRATNYIILEDILPSIMSGLGIETPDYVRGKTFWV